MTRNCTFRPGITYALLLLSICSLRAEDAPKLDALKTHAVIVGVLHWENISVTSYPEEERKDQELYDTLAKMGVPERNMALLLDEEGTLANIRKALKEVASKTKKGDTFIFYYAGHGVPARDGVAFLNYDAGKKPNFAVSEIADILQREYQGERVLMFADCCFSGGLAEPAKSLSEHGFKAASITSADASNVSTNNWTFTHILIDILRGSPAADRNGDQVISISEAAVEVADAMKFREQQRHGQSRFNIREDFRLCQATGMRAQKKVATKEFKRFEYVQVQDKGGWHPARIIEIRDEKFKAEIQQYARRRVVERKQAQIRRFPAVVFRQPVRIVARPKPEKVLEEQEALEKAKVGGKYDTLLKKVEVESDYRTYGEFRDYGHYPATNYSVYKNLPAGYWVYVYPNWYIWRSEPKR